MNCLRCSLPSKRTTGRCVPLHRVAVAGGCVHTRSSCQWLPIQHDNGAGELPDLAFNHASVLKYLEDYQQAFDGLLKAQSIDPTLPAAVCRVFP